MSQMSKRGATFEPLLEPNNTHNFGEHVEIKYNHVCQARVFTKKK